jgi:hypothetical protein
MVRRFIEPVTVHAFYNLIACTRTVYLLRASTVKWRLVFRFVAKRGGHFMKYG